MSTRHSLQQLADLADKRDEVRFSFIKQILLISSSLLGILVSLHKENTTDKFAKGAFVISIALIACGILLLAVALSSEVKMQKEIFNKWKAEVLKQSRDESYRPKMVFGEPPKFYERCEKGGYIMLTLSAISLTVYAIFIG